MFNVVLTPKELIYLVQRLALKIDSHLALTGLPAKKLTKAEREQVEKALTEGQSLVQDGASKELRVNTVVAGALGILAQPQALIEILVVSGEHQERRQYFGYKNTWLALARDNEDYILATPISEEIIRNFIFAHLTAGQLAESEILLQGEEIVVATALLELAGEKKGKQPGFNLSDVQNRLKKGDKQSLAVFQGIYGELTDEAIKQKLGSLVAKKLVTMKKEQYQLGADMTDLAGALANVRSLQITRYDFGIGKPNMRTLSLIQGDKVLYAQQAIVAQQPIVAFKQIDKVTAATLLSIVIFAPGNFADEFAPVFAAAKGASKKAKPESKPEPEVAPSQEAKKEAVVILPVTEEAKPSIEPVEPLVVCPACGVKLPAGAQFCRACGAKIVLPEVNKCAGCGEELPLDARFCRKCGKGVN